MDNSRVRSHCGLTIVAADERSRKIARLTSNEKSLLRPVSDYVAGRFDFTDEETVREHFGFSE